MEYDFYDGLVIGGGGLKGFIQLGALHYASDHNLLSIKEYSGTSVGSMICYALACGLEPMQIFKELYINNIEIFDQKKLFDIENYGLISLVPAMEQFVNIIKTRNPNYDPKETFFDLMKRGINLYVAVTNLSSGQIEYWGPNTYPNEPILRAIAASCSVPFIFPRIIHNGDVKVDGGCLDNLPITPLLHKSKKILAILTDQMPPAIGDMGFIEYSYRVVMTTVKEVTRLRLGQVLKQAQDKGLDVDIFDIPFGDFSPIDIYISSSKKMQAFLQGYEFAKSKLQIDWTNW